jgi:hypothetical protein
MPETNPSLTIKIEYKEYISLSEFKESIDGWNNQYNSFLAQGSDDDKLDKLLIKEIKQGSIIIELVSAILPLMSDVNNVTAFYTSIKALFGWLSSKKGKKPKIISSDLDNTKKIIAPVNNHNGRQITVSIEGDNNAPIIIDSVIAKVISQNANEEYVVLDKKSVLLEIPENKDNVIFKLTQIKDDENPDKNTRGIIAEIDGKEHPVLFSDIGIKDLILQESNNPFRKNYLVNVKVNKSADTIKSFIILALNDSYNDEEEPGLFP